MNEPVLYSFRRCPYCMRAHMGLKKAALDIELRESSLKDLPAELLNVSEMKTVPVLVLPDGTVFEESWDILKWALAQNDPDNWLGDNSCYLPDAEMLVETNDFSFKADLDHYKYADRYPEHDQEYYRRQCEEFIEELEDMLAENTFLLSRRLTIADIAVFPFIRQFSLVDKTWFDQSAYNNVKNWLENLVATDLFRNIFRKHRNWQPGDPVTYI